MLARPPLPWVPLGRAAPLGRVASIALIVRPPVLPAGRCLLRPATETSPCLSPRSFFPSKIPTWMPARRPRNGRCAQPMHADDRVEDPLVGRR